MNTHNKAHKNTNIELDKLKEDMLGNLAQKAFGRTLSTNNIFVEREKRNLKAFNKTSVNIPWYLNLFRGIITDIAYESFKNGLSEGCTDTVTFKRPAEYIAKSTEIIKGESDE